ncbi:hypothetical protein [Lysinibacter cavernae]|uniref:SPOR domain-containing protein n=1 Tax=Lysinibacter cavernae TaxID=1640652 RepID=A0A7X5QZ66_9MICO|nr:hypothetical protein [Lysinibacter cavernae]NIH52639.1 hypothetical protein [Lysinibacter cavernae]
MSENPDTQFWFNSRTGEVEKGPQSLAQYRVGPFATEAEAARAPEVIKERAAKWAAEEAAED